MLPAADANFKSQISCPSQRERGRLTGQRSARYLALFEFHKYQGGRYLAFDVIIQEIIQLSN